MHIDRKRLFIGDKRIHNLRQAQLCFATIKQGIPLLVLSKLLGYQKSLAMTLRYTHLNTEDVAMATERVGTVIERQLEGDWEEGLQIGC